MQQLIIPGPERTPANSVQIRRRRPGSQPDDHRIGRADVAAWKTVGQYSSKATAPLPSASASAGSALPMSSRWHTRISTGRMNTQSRIVDVGSSYSVKFRRSHRWNAALVAQLLPARKLYRRGSRPENGIDGSRPCLVIFSEAVLCCGPMHDARLTRLFIPQHRSFQDHFFPDDRIQAGTPSRRGVAAGLHSSFASGSGTRSSVLDAQSLWEMTSSPRSEHVAYIVLTVWRRQREVFPQTLMVEENELKRSPSWIPLDLLTQQPCQPKSGGTDKLLVRQKAISLPFSSRSQIACRDFVDKHISSYFR